MERKYGLIGVTFFILLLSNGTAVADPVVVGKVYNDTEPVADARVVVSCGGVEKEAYTTLNGTYAVDFTNTSCGTGETVTLTAVKGNMVGGNTGVIEDFTFIEIGIVNVWLSPPPIPMTELPEFATPVLPMALAFGTYLYLRRMGPRWG